MSNFPTVEKTIETLLKTIIALKPPEREAQAKPHLITLLSHPTIKPLLNSGNAPASTEATPNSDLTHIRNTLTALTKAVDSLQAKVTTSSKTKHTSPHTKGKDPSSPSPRSYSVITGSRPPVTFSALYDYLFLSLVT